MYDITLIATIHSESGQCNSDELYRIIESINPEVIFDELPPHFSDMYYSDSFDMHSTNNILLNMKPVLPLEVKCIKRYKQSYTIKIVPVDIDIRHKLSEHQDDIYFMFLTFFKYEDYKKLDKMKDAFIAQEGFHFLNSDKLLDYLEEKEAIEKNIIESNLNLHKNRLFDIYKLFHAQQYDNRENAMLQEIYNYSKKNQYKQAVFLIGAEHKKSIMQKIAEYEKLSEIKLNWTMYGTK